MVDSVRNILFGAPGSGAGGQDLFALDVERGRDTGLPTLNQTRVAYGLAPYTSFAQLTSDPTLQAELQTLYGTVDNVELFVGGLAEDHAAGSSVGSTFGAVIADQFERLRDGDRLWYQNTLSGSALAAAQNTTLADLIAANTNLTNLQEDVFFFTPGTISGTVDATSNARGSQSVGQIGLTVQLIDLRGRVVQTTTTDQNGDYSFTGLQSGKTFLVHVVTGQQFTLLSALTATKVATLANTDNAGDYNIDFSLKLNASQPGHGSGGGGIFGGGFGGIFGGGRGNGGRF
jgi:hypothetical protein